MEQTKQLKWYQKALMNTIYKPLKWLVNFWLSLTLATQLHVIICTVLYLFFSQRPEIAQFLNSYQDIVVFQNFTASAVVVTIIAVAKEAFDKLIKPLYKKNYTPLFDWMDIVASVAIPYLISAISLVT